MSGVLRIETFTQAPWKDLTFEPEFQGVMGFTEVEIREYFPTELQELAHSLEISADDLLTDLHNQLGGYSWGGKQVVFLPDGIIRALSQQGLRYSWWELTTPSFLAKLTPAIIDEWVSREALSVGSNQYSERGITCVSTLELHEWKALLFLTGSYTLSLSNSKNSTSQLTFPNFLPKERWISSLLRAYTQNQMLDPYVSIVDLKRALDEENLSLFVKRINNLLRLTGFYPFFTG